jgi:hypothetical protein
VGLSHSLRRIWRGCLVVSHGELFRVSRLRKNETFEGVRRHTRVEERGRLNQDALPVIGRT